MSFIRDIAFGVAGFVVLVLIGMFTHKMYNRHKSRRRSSARRGRSRSRGRERSRHYDEDEDETTFSPWKESVASSQSYEYSLEDGITSPKSPRRKHKRRDHQPSEADSAFSSENDDIDTSVMDQMTRTVESFVDEQPKRVRREIFAPAGKLGIIVDTSSEGPIVHSIKNDSPLVGKVFTGDFIIAVDDEDVSDWSAHYVTKLVARKSGSVRKLTLLSNQWDD